MGRVPYQGEGRSRKQKKELGVWMTFGTIPITHYDRCRRPRGALPRRLQFPVFPETDLAPPCLEEALRRGALPTSSIYMIFIELV